MKKVMLFIALLGFTASANANKGKPATLILVDQLAYSLTAPSALSAHDKGDKIAVTAVVELDCNQGIDELLIKHHLVLDNSGTHFKLVVGAVVRTNSAIKCALETPVAKSMTQTVQAGNFIPFNGVVEAMVIH